MGIDFPQNRHHNSFLSAFTTVFYRTPIFTDAALAQLNNTGPKEFIWLESEQIGDARQVVNFPAILVIDEFAHPEITSTAPRGQRVLVVAVPTEQGADIFGQKS